MLRFMISLLCLTCTAVCAQPVISHFISVAGSKMYVEESGKGRALILLHAGNMDHRMWEGQVSVLSSRFHVFNCDLRGCGLTQDGDSTYLQSDALLAMMDSLHISKASITGVSLGAVAATAFALAQADRVEKLVLVSPGLIGLDLNHDPVLVRYSRQMQEALEKHDTTAYTELFIKAWVDGPVRTPAQVNSTVRKKAFAIAYENIVKRKAGVHIGLAYEPTQAQQLSKLRMPILVITGANDMKDIHIVAEAYRKNGAKVVNILSAAHMVNMEKPAAFNKLVLGFL